MRELNKVMRAEIRAPGSRGSKSNLVGYSEFSYSFKNCFLPILLPFEFTSFNVQFTLILMIIHSFFYKNKVYKNIEAQNC